jgi:hypothetical protein
VRSCLSRFSGNGDEDQRRNIFAHASLECSDRMPPEFVLQPKTRPSRYPLSDLMVRGKKRATTVMLLSLSYWLHCLGFGCDPGRQSRRKDRKAYPQPRRSGRPVRAGQQQRLDCGNLALIRAKWSFSSRLGRLCGGANYDILSSKKSLNVESPSFTPANIQPPSKKASLTSQAANAPAFTPKGLGGKPYHLDNV